MSLTNRNVILMAMVMLFIILTTVLTGMIISEQDDELPDDDDFLGADSFAAGWFRVPIGQLSFILMLGMSIFALVVVYRGGRSNHRHFNDRTIDSVNVFRGTFFATALNRAVFVFLFIASLPVNKNNGFIGVVLPTINPDMRRYQVKMCPIYPIKPEIQINKRRY